MEKTYDIAALGSCGVDIVTLVPELPSENKKVPATKLIVSPGGLTGNSVTQAGKLGARSIWLGSLGNDNWKEYLLNEFKEAHVEAHPVILDNEPTQQYWIATNPAGMSSMVGLAGAAAKLTPDHVRSDFADIIRSSRHYNTEIGLSVPLAAEVAGAEIAREAGVKVLVDMDNNPWPILTPDQIGSEAELLHLLQLTDVVKCSEVGFLGFLREPTFSPSLVQRIFPFGPKLVVVTLGEHGCIIATPEQTISCPAFPITPIDTVGAGDAFMGGLSYALLQDWPLEKVGQFANACGAFKCIHQGTRASGTLAEIEEFINKHS